MGNLLISCTRSHLLRSRASSLVFTTAVQERSLRSLNACRQLRSRKAAEASLPSGPARQLRTTFAASLASTAPLNSAASRGVTRLRARLLSCSSWILSAPAASLLAQNHGARTAVARIPADRSQAHYPLAALVQFSGAPLPG